MLRGSDWKYDGVPMFVVEPEDDADRIIVQTVYSVATAAMRATYPQLSPVLDSFDDPETGHRHVLVTGKRWRLFLATDGTGEIGAFIDTGNGLDESDILEISELGIAGPSSLMDSLKAVHA